MMYLLQWKELYKEAIIWTQLKHENIVSLFGICKNILGGRAALILPWMKNGNLADYLDRNPGADRMTFVWHFVLLCMTNADFKLEI